MYVPFVPPGTPLAMTGVSVILEVVVAAFLVLGGLVVLRMGSRRGKRDRVGR